MSVHQVPPTTARSRVGRLAALAVASATACVVVPVAVAPSATAADPVTIQLLNLNDFHGRIDANTTKLATTVEGLRAQHGDDSTLLLSNGDNIGASLFASAVQQDEPTLDVLNALDVAASSAGNHEFDQGYDDLTGRVADRAEFPFLGANVYDKGTTNPALPEFELLEVQGQTVAVIGAVTLETEDIVSPAGIATIEFGDPVEAVNRVAGELSDGDEANGEADVIVAEYHEGANAATSLDAAKADRPEFADIVDGTSAAVDVIFTGHTHQKYAYDAPVPGGEGTRPVLQTGQYGENVGQVLLSVDPATGDVVSYQQANVARSATENVALPRVAAVKQITDAALAFAAEVGNQPVGEITGDITRAYNSAGAAVRDAQSSLGGLVGNALRDGIPSDLGAADIGIVNPGGLRDDLLFAGNPSVPGNTDGVVTVAEANNVLPFLNNIWLVELTGADLKAVLEQQWPVEGRSTTLRLGLSDNMSVTVDPAGPVGDRVKNIWIDGELVGPEDTYTVSTFNFLAQGGDSFSAFTNGTSRDTGLVDRDLWLSYLEDNSPIDPDFAVRQVNAPAVPTQLGVGETAEFTVAGLDLTSRGAPANEALVAEVYDAEGEFVADAGEFTVTGGQAAVELQVPIEAEAGDSVYLVSYPGGTVVGPIEVVDNRPASTVTGPGTATGFYNQYTAIPVQVDSAEGTGTGVVELRWGSYVHRAAVGADGRAVLALPKTFAPGTYRVGVYYLGDESTARSSAGVVVTINKARSVLKISAWPQPIPTGRTGTLGIEVGNSSGAPYSGWANVSYGGTGLRVFVNRGFARVTLPPKNTGWYRLTVWTDGTNLIAPAAAAISVPVRR
ncbi:bifunctional metallophosphatase/5'-nucleotidase [Nocardioides sp. ChNu-153]|uniref:bifunctional metallophosphatase/5'-nucleotidase n=1 Tax=unclassified Nocardioides TaxID=2615069 RepID=UPI002406BCF7|nr:MULTISPECIES: bifunctional UDP-sugar hydrolase/5'-nucleotidase [unclassified Nocardioides]MDF9715781.1 bifunctional metallophosphatase/5'-nucleotidase [Nocardioides sp. ChNu-99]MDN7121886.1 bifunctional metallophosphatase/5'-nucleotidase [Nocardioides sp. ChNu-153]